MHRMNEATMSSTSLHEVASTIGGQPTITAVTSFEPPARSRDDLERDELDVIQRCEKKTKKTRKKKTRSRKSRKIFDSSHECSSKSSNRSKHSSVPRQDQQQRVFIGQLSYEMNEQQLRTILKPFGDISQVNICRDKNTGGSQRCCFVTFVRRNSARAACEALHNKFTVPGMSKPLQVKFADYYSNYRQRKVFIGMIPKDLTEAELVTMFRLFGDVEECSLTRDHCGQSKGSAFVTFVDRQSAADAIANMHQSRVMPGCRFPLVVKLADSKATKLLKKVDKYAPANARQISAQATNFSHRSETNANTIQQRPVAAKPVLSLNTAFVGIEPTTVYQTGCPNINLRLLGYTPSPVWQTIGTQYHPFGVLSLTTVATQLPC